MPAPGAPGFVGARLKEAREARGLSAASLADLTGISRQAVSQYEHSQAAPSIDRLEGIATTLNLPVAYFLRDARVAVDRPVFFRSQAAATKADQIKSERRMEWLEDVCTFVSAHVTLPDVDLPDVSHLQGPAGWTPLTIEDAATEVRRVWGVGTGPIADMVNLLEHHGAVVTRGVVETDRIDAFTVRLLDGGRPALFLGSDKDSAARSRFDAAHELGHHVLHADVSRSDLANPVTRKSLEGQAHRFASAFLMPARDFLLDLRSPTLESMRLAKSRWRVSIGAMIQRCIDLEVLDQRESQRLWILRSKRGWARREPLDDQLPLERPTVLRRAIDLVTSEGSYPREAIAADIVLSPADIEALASLSRGSLTSDEPAISLRTQDGSSPGQLVPFPRKS